MLNRVFMSCTINSFSLSGQFEAFKCRIGASFYSPARMYRAITNSHYYEAIQPFLKGVQKLHYVAELLFNKFLPEAELTGFQKIVIDHTLTTLLSAAEVASKLKNFTNILKVFELPSLIFKSIKSRRDALESNDPEKIWLANLKMFTMAEAMFDTPEKIYKFAALFFSSIPAIIKEITIPCNAVSLILSIAGPIISGHHCYTTTQLIDIFEAKRYRTFIKEYSNKGGLAVPNKPLKQLSTSKLKKYVLQIEMELSGPEKTDLFLEIEHKANVAYINKIRKEIGKDSSLIKNQFKVSLKKSKGEEKVEKNFFDRLGSKRVQNEPERAAAIVKNLNERLKHKVSFDKFSIATKFLGYIPSILSTIVSVGTLYAPQIAVGATFTPVAAAITGVLAFAAVIDIFYRHYQEQLFIESMEALTKKSPASPA